MKQLFAVISMAVFIGILLADFDNAKQFIFTQSYYNRDITRSINKLSSSYPATKFKVYYSPWDISGPVYAFSFLLSERKMVDKNGLPLGLTRYTDLDTKNTKIMGDVAGLVVINPHEAHWKTVARNWVPSNPEDIYDDLIMRWTREEKLTATFSLDKYILERLHLKN